MRLPCCVRFHRIHPGRRPTRWLGERLLVLVLAALAAGLGPARSIDAQRRDTTTRAPAASVPACCKVVALDSATRTVTARESATEYAFRFRVPDVRAFAALELGDPVWADFANRVVRIGTASAEPCCTILPAPAPDATRQAPRVPDGDLAPHPAHSADPNREHSSCIR